MEYNILITGVSGYLGGTLLNRLKNAPLPKYHKLFALIRNPDQAHAVKQYAAEPLVFDIHDYESVLDNIQKYKINVVFSLVDAYSSTCQEHFIRALSELKKKTGQVVHFLHTSGAKAFSDHAGAPVDRTILDTEHSLLELQKSQHTDLPALQQLVGANTKIVELSESLGVRSYIFCPCMVYGKGEGFGNQVSIQTVAIVSTARATGHVRNLNESQQAEGFYLASSGRVAWKDVYASIGAALFKRGLIKDSAVHPADEKVLAAMAETLKSSTDMVAPQLSGECTFTAKHGYEIGWKPLFPPDHIFEVMDEEVNLILSSNADKSERTQRNGAF
ncbi:hypothetical protein BDQ94DRAFT_165549 [Aspergillus welwitschiae]|uniref:NAD-dependent epimerase/dehydratase domain-containing protein n=1 Tax=Aspergillus welwitschiae TaxID=1341132 RepID=A0A3F3QGJ5_9EURO|nr:hypothetical protein BDQ94DRAFT_165549 [Aspergillus welwitschiae]RDH38404.1 hypothetical protein BDQ94DRAFT_165549 [Aspergillus welwitschiae]